MALTALTIPLRTESEERHTESEERRTDDPDVDQIPNFPGMYLAGAKKRILVVLLLVFTIIFLILNITMFFVGITSCKDCPIQPNIPIYLIVAGILGIANKALTSIYFCKGDISFLKHIWQALLAIEVVWSIVGSYWVYSIYKPNFVAAPLTPYCNKTVYLLAFWLLTTHYIFGIFLLVLTCCLIFGFLYSGLTSTEKK